MYSLHLYCAAHDVDRLSAELWELRTEGIREIDNGDETTLIATFATNDRREFLLERFENYAAEWEQEEDTDWLQYSRDAWPSRVVGEHLFLAPPWNTEPTPEDRRRIVHNPGLACGTGEHPCTQMALEALEQCVQENTRLADIGTGSGLLAIAACMLGARSIIATDLDEAALAATQENFALNLLPAPLVVGSADCIAQEFADVTVANISGTVLVSILDDLLRITKPAGRLILTGFPQSELHFFQQRFPGATITELAEWRCVTTNAS